MYRYFLILLLTVANLANAQEAIKRYQTTKLTGVAPDIDGLLDDAAWSTVEWAGDFVQREPTFGIAPSQKTAFKVIYDDKNLYVGIRAYDTEPDKIVSRMSRRDGFEGDLVEINIDSYHDKRTAFSFTASVSGVKGDEYVSNNGNDWDDTWDPIWYLATSVDSLGWIAEFRIPLSQLRFADLPSHTWGIQVMRMIFRLNERSTWQPIPQDAPGYVHLFGEIDGIAGIKPQKQLEIQPYVVAKTERYKAEQGNPFADGIDNSLDFGVDAKIGLTSDITLDLTINPDFGQVEADPSQVNLTAFRLYFQERRPFFLEGNNILNFPLVGFNENNLFYSRQIGGAPSYYPSGQYVRMPQFTRMLGAAKVTGKNSKGFSWGVMEALTANETASVIDNGEERREKVEPMTNYVVARFQQDIKEGETVVGAMATATNRFIEEPHLDFLHTNAYSGGMDVVHNFKERKYAITFRGIFSNVNGSTRSIAQTQQAPERFFQRPNNFYSRFDPMRTSLTGSGATFFVSKQSGAFLWDVGGTYSSPQLELNDAGFLVQTDNITHWIWTQYRILKPKGIFRSQRYELIGWRGYDFDLVNLESGYELGFYQEFKNLWFLRYGTIFFGENTSNADLRGGPSMRYPGYQNIFFSLNTNDQKKLRVSLNHNYSFGSYNYRKSRNVSASIVYRPINALSVSMSPAYTSSHHDLQYVTDLRPPLHEHRYILGTVDQKIYRLTMRSSYNLTPNLTFELWAQPFIATGDFSNFKHTLVPFADEYSERFRHFLPTELRHESNEIHVLENGQTAGYSFSNPNFNLREIRTNLVMRWEYIPGSTFFLVWSSNGSAFDSNSDSQFRHQWNELWNVNARNTFLLKYTYRFVL